MNDAVLLELSARWEREAKAPEIEDGSPDAKIGNAEAHGRRQGLRECADALRMLVSLLGESDQVSGFRPGQVVMVDAADVGRRSYGPLKIDR